MATTKASEPESTRMDGQARSEPVSRAALHRLIDELPESDIAVAMQHLEDLAAGKDPRQQALIARWIRPYPHRPGVAEAVVADSYVPVYALIGHLGAVRGQIDQAAEAYDVPREAVEAAYAYYLRHRAVIDARVYTGEPAGGNGR